MQNTSETWKSLASIEGTYVESRAIINNTEYSDIEPPVVTRALMQDGLEVGNVVSAMCTFVLDDTNNIPKSAEVRIETRLVGSVNGEAVNSEWLPQGTFFVSKRVRDPMIGMRQFECYDALLKTNAVWEPASSTWPQQTEDILDEILLVIGLELDARTSITSYPISQPDSGTTMRDVLSIIAQHNGGNWIVTPDNKLRLVPIQDLNDAGEDVVEIESVIGEYYTGEINEISGIRVVSEDGDILIGDETGAVVSVTIPEMIAVDLAEVLIGKTYRPFSFGNAGYDIAAELGDYIRCEDAVSVVYAETITLGTTMHGDISAPDLAEIVDEYPYVGLSNKTLVAAKAYAKEYADDAIGEYDDDLTQQEIFNRLTDNGAAQGLVLYNGQLYINASYVNAGRMNVGRVDFNEPESYYDVPNENDPASLLNGQAVVDGWIVNTSGGEYITVFSCGFAIPLRGKTVTVTFAFNGTLSGGQNSWTFISDKAQQMGANQDWAMPSGTTPNPYTYSVAVPDDAMSFSIAMECAGVKQIEVSLDSPVTPSESIVYNYEGQRIGEGYPFRVYRDGTLITQGKSLFNGVARISKLYLNFPLAVDGGGTGATNAASARANLEITPANIGALATAGGTMTGDIDMGQSGASSGAPSIKWRTADGTVFSFRPYGNTFQLVRGEGSSASSVLTINSDGTLYVNPQANWRSALGVVPSIVSLTAGANVSVDWQSNVAVSGVLIFNANVTVNSAITGSGKTVLTLPSGYKAASLSSPFLAGRFGGATHQLYMAANSSTIITGFGATSIPAGDYVLSGVILLG